LLIFCFFPILEWPPEREKVKKAADHCRQILNYVNQAVREAENKQVKRKNKTQDSLGTTKWVHLESEITERIIVQLISRTFV
jgi:hypothetical protein